MSHNPPHNELLTGLRLRAGPLEVDGTELFAEKLRIWGVQPDDPDAAAVRGQLERIRLSVDDQSWLLETSENIAKAERAKAAWNPKGDLAQYMNLCKIATAAARLSKEIGELFSPPWTDERAPMGALVAELAAFIEGNFNATTVIGQDVSVAVATATVRAMKQRRSRNSHVHWELISDLVWLASAKKARISERSVRRYLEDQRRPRTPVRDYWRRNFKLIREALRLNPLQKPASPSWVYDPSSGPPRPISGGASKRQRKAIEAFTGMARQYLEAPDPPNSKAAKTAKKRS